MILSESQKDTCINAGRIISNLDFLTHREEFQEFIAQFQRRADEMAEQILESDNLSPDERERLRQRRKGILEVILSPDEDMRANRNILDQYHGGLEIED